MKKHKVIQKQPVHKPVPDWEKELRGILTRIMQPYRESGQYILDTERGHFVERVVSDVRNHIPVSQAVIHALSECLERKTWKVFPDELTAAISAEVQRLYAVEPTQAA